MTIENGQLTIIGATNVVHFCMSVKVCRETPQESSKKTFPTGEGGPPQRWMRGGTALPIVGTTGAKVDLPSLTVGNGLCAVPGRCNYNPCGQNGTTHRLCHSERTVVSRGIFPSSKFYLVLVHHPTWWIPPFALLGRNDKRYHVPPLCHSERTQ